MPRKRLKENIGLPKRWRLKHGAYYYQVPTGKESQWDGKKLFRLGKTLPEAYREWATHLEKYEDAKTVADLLDRYLLEIIPTKAKSTHADLERYIREFRIVFGKLPMNKIQPIHIYQYYDKKGSTAAARRAIDVLSAAYTKAVQWGYISFHPFKGQVRLESKPPRNRYVEDWEILELLELKPKRKNDPIKMLHAYIKIKLLTGMSRKDLLLLTETQIRKDGIHIQRHKTRQSSGKKTIYEWSHVLREAVEEAQAARLVHITPYLFATRRGLPYYNDEKGNASGFDSLWQRFIKRVIEETKITERFTEHDLRAKAGSDAENLEHARALLSHSNSNITQKVYRRKAERVKPTNQHFNSTKEV